VSIAIDQAFTSAMMGGGFAMDIVHENGGYSVWDGVSYVSHDGVYQPQARREFMEIRTIPATRAAWSLADTDESLGVFFVMLKYPDDVGAIVAKVKAEAVLSLLKVGARFTYAGQVVEIASNNRDGGRNDGGFYQIAIRANYRAFVAR